MIGLVVLSTVLIGTFNVWLMFPWLLLVWAGSLAYDALNRRYEQHKHTR